MSDQPPILLGEYRNTIGGKDKFTRTGRPWTLVYREEFESLIEARGRERYIKRMKSENLLKCNQSE